jgi:uncharacterized membrane protein
MDNKAVEWLYQQLPELVEKGIIPAQSAERLQAYYGPVDKQLKSKPVLLLFSIIGAILIGLGIILILAHNWNHLTNVTRLLISVGLLLVAQILAANIIWFKKNHSAWAEGGATFLMLMVGASMTLVGQTYHIVDDTSTFLLTWMLLSLPLIYLMGVTTPAILYLLGITVWTATNHFGIVDKQLTWVLLALAMPYYWRLLKRNRYGNSAIIFTLVLTICFYICFGIVFSNYIHTLASLIWATLVSVSFLVGLLWFDGAVDTGRSPLQAIGLAGSISIAYILTFKWQWSRLNWQAYPPGSGEYLLALTLLVLVIGLGAMLLQKKRYNNVLLGILPLVVGFGYILQYFDASGINATILLNAYVLWLSITIILTGVRQSKIGLLNIGMVMLAFLVAARFLDIDFSFVVRGLTFVVLGICFLIANLLMLRRKNEVIK